MVLPATWTIKWLGCKTLEHPQCPKTKRRSWPWSEEDDEREAKNDKHEKFLQSDKCLVKSEWFELDKSSMLASAPKDHCEITMRVIYMDKIDCLFFNLHRSRRPVSLVCLKPRGFWQKLLPSSKLSLSGFKSNRTDGTALVKTFQMELSSDSFSAERSGAGGRSI